MNKKRLVAGCIAGMLVVTGCSNFCTSESGEEKAGKSAAEADSTVTESKTQVTVTTQGDQVATKDLFAMDTYMTLTAYGDKGEEAVDQAAEEIKRLDQALSTGNRDSQVSKLNANAGGSLTEDTQYLLEKSLDLYTSTGGLFDIAIYPVMEAWGFPTQDYKVPDKSELQKLLTLADVSKIQYIEEENTVKFEEEGMKIDFGGIAKGYTSSRIMKIYKDLGVITSGGYERYFEEDGKTYHHIIDPRTGYPADSGLLSVTIVSSDGTLADGLSTSLFIMGKEEAIKYWKDHSEEFDGILETEDGTLYVTEGIAEDFEAKEHKMEVVTLKE